MLEETLQFVKDRLAFHEFREEVQASPGRVGCIVGYLQGAANLSDPRKVKLLLALTEATHALAQKYDQPNQESSSAQVQIGNSLYSLTASGALQTLQCEVMPQMLSAHLTPGSPMASSESTCSTHMSTAQSNLQLDVRVADLLATDKLRVHLEGDCTLLYLDASTAEQAQAQGSKEVWLTVAGPFAAKPIAVELMRGPFASQKFDVEMMPAPVRYRKYCTCYALRHPEQGCCKAMFCTVLLSLVYIAIKELYYCGALFVLHGRQTPISCLV